jgi:DNA-binding NarL/FixJ family response regulator
MINVVLVDDQDLVREGIAMLLSQQEDISVVGQAADGETAVDMIRQLQPDVALMDVRMPGMDGVEATRHITADGFSTDPDRPVKVLVLTTYRADEHVYAALRVGASGFALKDRTASDLLRAIRVVASGEVWLDPSVAKSLVSEFTARPVVAGEGHLKLSQLTARETEVLSLLSHGYSNQEIAHHLSLGETTVKTHVGRILMKLDLRDRTQAVAMAYQTGLAKPGSAPPPSSHRKSPGL